jgi:hypothetical protein
VGGGTCASTDPNTNGRTSKETRTANEMGRNVDLDFKPSLFSTCIKYCEKPEKIVIA